MSQLEPIALIARAAAAALAGELELHVGDEVVARVATAPGPDGRGVISLAGFLHPARLPGGLREGQKLRLQVAGAEEGALLLRLVEDDTGSAASPARVAGALALKGDGELLRAAIALAPGAAFALPDGSSACVAFEEESPASRAGDETATASVLLHSPALGPIEVRLYLDAAALAAIVTVEPGRATDVADRAAPELAAALERAVSRPASVSVSARSAEESRPQPPRPEDVFDAYA